MVKNNICDFYGDIKIIKGFEFIITEEGWPHSGIIFAEYNFKEDNTQSHSGMFSGIVESSFYIDDTTNTIRLDESWDIADGYCNNTFVGIWQSYENGKIKKCIWGDYRLPFTFDFDIGDGEMEVNSKYVKNGWESFNSREEYKYNEETQSNELKNKWWSK